MGKEVDGTLKLRESMTCTNIGDRAEHTEIRSEVVSHTELDISMKRMVSCKQIISTMNGEDPASDCLQFLTYLSQG